MSERAETTRTINVKIADVKSQLSRLIDTVSHEGTRVLIEQAGTPVAALVSVEDLQRLDQQDEQRESRFAVVDQMREAFKDVPPEEIERRVVAIIRGLREANEATIRAEEQALAERRPA